MGHTKVITFRHALCTTLKPLLGPFFVLILSQPLVAQGPRLAAGTAGSEMLAYADEARLGDVEFPSAPESSSSETTSRIMAAALPVETIGLEPTIAPRTDERHHAFWDRENRLLFAANGAMATADFITTRANLASGGKELNPFSRVLAGSTPGLAANFALETGGLVTLSYIFHKTGHHKLERLLPVVNFGVSAGAVAYNLKH